MTNTTNTTNTTNDNTMTKKTRKRKKRGDILVSIIDKLSTINPVLNPAQIESITNMLTVEMQVTTTTSTKIEPIVVDGITLYPCSRTNKFFILEDMVTSANGESKGYSIASQNKLTEVNNKLKDLQKEVLDALATLNTDDAVKISKEIKELTDAKESKAVYSEIEGYTA